MGAKRPTPSKESGCKGGGPWVWEVDRVKFSSIEGKGGRICPLPFMALMWGENWSPKVAPRTKVGPPYRDYTVLDFEVPVWHKGTHAAENLSPGGVGETPQNSRVVVLELG